MALPPETEGVLELPSPVRFGPFLLTRRIAVGGSSDVYLAEPVTGSAPAPRLIVKRLRAIRRTDPESVSAFAREAELHRRVDHPNVVHVFGAGEVDGEPFLAMQYVDGSDAHRLLRRLDREGLALPSPVVAYIGCALAVALSAVHDATDEFGLPLHILHRDVTPSNVYLSRDGDVLLGDFGIAGKVSGRATRPDDNSAIKGKYGYLAPEQVNAESADHRADLFSLGVCLAELLLGGPLFEGDADFAVLLSIRDGRIDNLNRLAGRVPDGLLALLRRVLARRPEDRFRSAGDLAEALRAFLPRTPEAGPAAVREWVAWASDTEDIARRLEEAIQESERGEHGTVDRKTRDIGPIPVRLSQGQITVTFARLIEMIVTGDIDAETQVNWLGDGFRPVGEIEVLERHLPDALTTQTQDTPGQPDLSSTLAPEPLLLFLAKLRAQAETGMMLVDGGPDGHRRKEAYLLRGSVIHVSSSDGSELLGQSLVRRGIIASDELDLALAMLSRFDGRLGDTLLALGLLDTVQLFQALQEQAKTRLVRLFERSSGRVVFYRNVRTNRLETPVDLDLIPIMLAGIEIGFPGQTPIERHRANVDRLLRRGAGVVDRTRVPRPIVALVEALGGGKMTLRHLVMRLSTSSVLAPPDAVRALDVALALDFIEME